MTTYAEVNADGIVTSIVENNGESYTPADGSFLIQSAAFAVGSRYEPVAGNYPLAFASLGTPAQAKVNKTKAATDGDAS